MSTSFQAKRRFYDDKHFRRGFSRSGNFTIKEADLLECSGYAFKALEEGLSQPQDAVEEDFLRVCQGELAPSTPEQKVWLKYKKLTGRQRFHGLVSSPVKEASSDNDEVEEEVDTADLNVDDE